MKKYMAGAAIALVTLLGMTGASNAAVYGYSDLVNHINYSLTLTPTGTNTFSAVFDVNGVPTPPANFYATAFTFKFSSSDSYNISSLTPPAASTQPWLIADYNRTLRDKPFRSHN